MLEFERTPDPECELCAGSGKYNTETQDEEGFDQWLHCPCNPIPTAVLRIGPEQGVEGLRAELLYFTKIRQYCENNGEWYVEGLTFDFPCDGHHEIQRRVLRLNLAPPGPDPGCEECGNRHQGPRPGEIYAGSEGEVSEPCPCHRPGLTGAQVLEVLESIKGLHPSVLEDRRLRRVYIEEDLGITIEVASCAEPGCVEGKTEREIDDGRCVQLVTCPTCGVLR